MTELTANIIRMAITKRAIATVIDAGICAVFISLVIVGIGDYRDGKYVLEGAPMVVLLVLCYLYFLLMEYYLQATLGKMVMGLRVISIDGSRPTLLMICKRRLLDFIEIYPCMGTVAIITTVLTHNNQRLGDLWARSKVVDKKSLESRKVEENFLHFSTASDRD